MLVDKINAFLLTFFWKVFLLGDLFNHHFGFGTLFFKSIGKLFVKHSALQCIREMLPLCSLPSLLRGCLH